MYLKFAIFHKNSPTLKKYNFEFISKYNLSFLTNQDNTFFLGFFQEIIVEFSNDSQG